MPEINKERSKEDIQKALDDVQKQLNDLYDTINKQEYRTKEQTKKLEELEKQEDDLKKELGLKKWASPESSESLDMSKDDAIKYLESIKDKSWGDLSREGRNWIAAVQVVLKDKGYTVWKIDWYLGRGRSKTRRAVKAFQRANGLRVDWKPWTKTINSLLGNVYKENKKEEKVQDEVDKEWGKFTWTKRDGRPRDWTYTDKDGEKYTVKEWKIQDENTKVENKKEEKVQDEVDKEWGKFTWTKRDGRPRDWTYTDKDGEKYTVKEWKIV